MGREAKIMPTTLGDRFIPTWGGYPPHMSSEDLNLWKKYKYKILSEAIAMYFDVGLGGQTEVPEDTTPEMATMWLRNTQKRADVILETIDRWVIIELRENATSAAAGRLLQYRELWKQDPPDDKPVILRLVSSSYDMDLNGLCQTLKIEYIRA